MKFIKKLIDKDSACGERDTSSSGLLAGVVTEIYTRRLFPSYCGKPLRLTVIGLPRIRMKSVRLKSVRWSAQHTVTDRSETVAVLILPPLKKIQDRHSQIPPYAYLRCSTSHQNESKEAMSGPLSSVRVLRVWNCVPPNTACCTFVRTVLCLLRTSILLQLTSDLSLMFKYRHSILSDKGLDESRHNYDTTAGYDADCCTTPMPHRDSNGSRFYSLQTFNNDYAAGCPTELNSFVYAGPKFLIRGE